MSMISAQCDELRALAGDGSTEFVTGPIRASVLRDAADTIWQLREAAVGNARLRELVLDLRDHILNDDGFGVDTGWMLDRMRELGIEVEP